MPNEYYKQYKKVFEKAHQTGKYKMFLFDVKSSKTHAKIDGENFYLSLREFVDEIVKELLRNEKQKGHKILHREASIEDLNTNQGVKDNVVLLKTQNSYIGKKVYRIDQCNPLLWLGDMIHVIVLRNSISDAEFYSVVQKCKDKTIPNYDLHYAHGYYHTDKWFAPNDELSRVYCIPILEYLCKENKKLITTSKNNQIEK